MVHGRGTTYISIILNESHNMATRTTQLNLDRDLKPRTEKLSRVGIFFWGLIFFYDWVLGFDKVA